MLISNFTVTSNNKIAENTFLIGVDASDFKEKLFPGQFFNIQVNNSSFPLLRRPFSISDYDGSNLFFMYKVVGEGTRILSEKRAGEKINLLGPLGNHFNVNSNADHLFLIGGGIGIAPFPYLIRKMRDKKNFTVIFGVRDKSEVHDYGLENVIYSSDNGSIGIHGNVLDLLDSELTKNKYDNVQIMACGPNAMFRALQKYLSNREIDCQISMESAMACGFGICQGCPIEHKNSEAYKLICKDGPIFNIGDVEI